MKNLKRVLSLVLATVMVIGMMVVGASAANYTDADKIDYTEAVDVMSAVGMISGIGNGDFAPTATIDRAGATKLITYLMLGTDVASKLTVSKAPFEDVSANAWYAPFVAFCAEKGLLEGYNGKFNPTGTIDAYGFAKLLLGALGYRADIENLTGDVWQINTATLAIQNGLFAGNDNAFANKALTREEACLYAFNALKATMVEYTGGTNVTLPGGTTVTTGAIRDEKFNASAKDYRSAGTDSLMQLCEYLYPTLKLDTTVSVTDDFGRPGYTWTFGKNDDTVTFVTDEAFATYAGADYQDAKADLVKKGYKFDTTTAYTYNGRTATNAIEKGEQAGKALVGATIELYTNGKHVDNVVVSQAYFTKVDDVKTNKKTEVTTVTLKVYEPGTSVVTKTIASDVNKGLYAMVEDYAKGDCFMGFYGDGYTLVAADDNFETVSGKVTATALDAGNNGWIKVDGEKYTTAFVYTGSKALAVKAEGTFYLYNGCVLRYEQTKAASASTDYAYIVDSYGKVDTTIEGSTPYIEVRAILADGTVAVYPVAVEKRSDSKWYVVNGTTEITTGASSNVTSVASGLITTGVFGYTLKNGVMTLETLGTTLAKNSTTLASHNSSNDIKKGITSVTSDKGTVLLTKDVIFVIYDDTTKTAKVVTGVDALGKTELDSYKAVVSGSSATLGTATVVFDTVSKGVVAEAGNYAFIDVDEYVVVLDGDDAKYAYTGYLADGSEIELIADTKLAAKLGYTNGLFEYTDENTVATVDRIDCTTKNVFTGTESVTYGRMFITGDMMNFNGKTVYYDISETNVVFVDADLDEVNNNAGWVVRNADGLIETIYVVAD